MIRFIRNIFTIPELRKRVLFTLFMLAVYRIGSQIVTPGLDADTIKRFFEGQRQTLLGFIDMFSGRNMSKMTIFALGIMPYISASIILQLLQVVWPYLERISKEGELGKKKITQYTRYGTVLICIVQGMGIAYFLEQQIFQGLPLVPPGQGGWSFRLLTVLTQTTGTMFIMWLGEQISERGIGNGISLIIFAGIVDSMVPGAVEIVKGGKYSALGIVFVLIFILGVVGFICFVEMGQRRIPITYAKRIQGRRMMGGQSTFLPLKVNTGGVIPIIFASSVITFPLTIAKIFENKSGIAKSIVEQLSMGMPLYTLLYVAAIIFFTYFYISIVFNPTDVSENLKKYGGFIPGIRAGKNTADFIDGVLSKLTFIGAIYLVVVALLPEFLITGIRFDRLPWIGEKIVSILPKFLYEGVGLDFYFGGTSILIVVGVAMDTMQQIESQLTMRNYDSFSRRGRIRGRRI